MSEHNEAVMVAKGMSAVHVRLRSRLASLLAASVALDLMASVVIYLTERGQSGTGIRTFGDALFWTSTQLLTVSSNLPNPLSTPARILDVVLQIWAISIVAILRPAAGAARPHPVRWVLCAAPPRGETGPPERVAQVRSTAAPADVVDRHTHRAGRLVERVAAPLEIGAHRRIALVQPGSKAR